MGSEKLADDYYNLEDITDLFHYLDNGFEHKEFTGNDDLCLLRVICALGVAKKSYSDFYNTMYDMSTRIIYDPLYYVRYDNLPLEINTEQYKSSKAYATVIKWRLARGK